MEHEPPATSTESGRAPVPTMVSAAVFFGFAGTFVAFLVGLVLMVEHTQGTCHRESYDYACTVHPHFGEGLAITALSVSVAAGIVLLAYLAGAILRTPRP